MFSIKTTNKFYNSNKGLIDRFLQDSGEKLKWVKPVMINFLDDESNSNDPLGRTAYYDPEGFSVSVYTTNRHPKDILRSMAHELIHHVQNCRGEFEELFKVEEGYAQKDQHLRKMEKEAYLKGNMYFRDWEDSYKNGKHKMKINEMVQQPAATNQLMSPKMFAKYWVERKNSKEIKPFETQLLFYNARVLLLNSNDPDSIAQFLISYKYLTGENFSIDSNPYTMKNIKNEYEIMGKLIGNILNRAKEMRLMENKKVIKEKHNFEKEKEAREEEESALSGEMPWYLNKNDPGNIKYYQDRKKKAEEAKAIREKPFADLSSVVSPASASKQIKPDLSKNQRISPSDIPYGDGHNWKVDPNTIPSGTPGRPSTTKRTPQQLSSPLINKIRKQLNVAIKGFGGANAASFKELPEGTVLGPRTFAAMNIVRAMKKLPPYPNKVVAFKDLRNFSKMLSTPALMDDDESKTKTPPRESLRIRPSIEDYEGLTPAGERDEYYQMEEGTKYMGYKPNQLVVERAELLEKKVWARLIEGKQNVWEDDEQEEEVCPECEKTDCKCEK